MLFEKWKYILPKRKGNVQCGFYWLIEWWTISCNADIMRFGPGRKASAWLWSGRLKSVQKIYIEDKRLCEVCDNTSGFSYKNKCKKTLLQLQEKSFPTAHYTKNCMRRHSTALSPPYFCFPLCFVSFFVALSFKSILHQRFTSRPNGCRKSCSV